jgi:hypothetical protein
MRSHPLRVLKQAAVFHVCRDAGRAEHVAAGVDAQARRQSAADHPKNVDPRQASRRGLAAASARRAEEGALPHSLQPRRLHISAEIHFKVMVRRHFMPFAALFVKPHPPPIAVAIIVLDFIATAALTPANV